MRLERDDRDQQEKPAKRQRGDQRLVALDEPDESDKEGEAGA